jgi:hypothetical protein
MKNRSIWRIVKKNNKRRRRRGEGDKHHRNIGRKTSYKRENRKNGKNKKCG